MIDNGVDVCCWSEKEKERKEREKEEGGLSREVG